jgi:orotidine-5'-phosphate decarboxylase
MSLSAHSLAARREKAASKVIVALDVSARQAMELAKQLQHQAKWLKVGMTLYYAAGPQIVRDLSELGFKVFLDLKFLDIPHQVRGAAASAAASGADLLSVHAMGGAEMLRAAAEGIDLCGNMYTKGLGITVLTSMNQANLAEVGVERPLQQQVSALAALACANGMAGVVASPKEAPMLRQQLGPDALIVTPGVRPAGAATGDQKRVTTPSQALAGGASMVVIGRPITGAADPVAAFNQIIDAIAEDTE